MPSPTDPTTVAPPMPAPMTPTPRVSVVIPTYGHADTVRATLDSVFAQGFTDHEVIVVNDGSPDDTADRLRTWAEAGRIRYLEQANAGVAAARNRGLAAARGEFVTFLDDDDLWPADKLSWQVEFLRANPDVGLVGGLVEMTDEHGRPREVRYAFAPGPVAFESLFGGNQFESPGQWLARTEIVRRLGGFDRRFWGTSDYDFLLRASRATRVVGVHRLALRYREHAGNSSKNLSRMLTDSEAVVRANLEHLPATRRPAAARAAYRFLYPYLGKPLLGEVGRDLRAGQLGRAGRTLGTLGRVFLRPALRDQREFARMLAPAIRRRLLGEPGRKAFAQL